MKQINENLNSAADSIATLTLFGYESLPAKIWAFTQMATAGADLQKISGLRFWKLLGTGAGKGGFSLLPNFSRYGLFGVWETESAARDFLQNSGRMKKHRNYSAEIWTVFLRPVKAHGLWSGKNPFKIPHVENFCQENAPIAILTRASIHLSKLKRFWSQVPEADAELEKAGGLIRSIGVGEAPFVRQATFSLWKTESAMFEFAYQSPVHREIIRRTRDENWYSEELFARFKPIASEGKWNGIDPLAEFFL